MADEKTCVKCGKKLRAGSPFATCGEHRTKEEQQEAWRRAAAQKRVKAGAKPRAADDGDDQVLERAGLPRTPPKAKSDALKRFRAVAEAMGHDPDELLAQYCEGWLLAVKEAVDKVQNGGG